ncbi:alkaline phosphatase family protein [Lacipirellula limnantheis]|uniref:Tetratricopeptide repeat protein n=1 Tax=Lacipirellula limnantheis TaxID=2528024 RepID=A0A517U1A1_9BACT|nr:alkaline phosphatase family protein [Lacipirellula limnantheis]QDT74399.1 tetratricopeptide repeat protein [Lacipirellula limnantheis]
MKPTEPLRTPDSPKRVLLVGWDAADWQMIRPLVEQGLMPTTAALIDAGAWGNLATTRPILSPMLWNAIATGKRPAQHGVLGFTEPSPDGGGVRPSASTSRKCKAIWNILTQCGLRSNVVGWYASHPAEPIAGVMVSNQFEQFNVADGQPSPVPPLSVHPAKLAEQLAELRVLSSEIDATAILPFIPSAAELVSQEGHRLGKLQQMLAQTATIHATATHLMATTEWDFTAVYYEGIDRFGHEFMHCHPPKMEQASQEEFAAYQHCMVGIYRFHDMMLQTLLALAGDDTAVILMSDHGYYNDHLRPDPREGKSGPVDWHRPFGILAAQGPGIRSGSRLYGASILDVTPTVLHLLGLPAALDMPGRVLAEVMANHAPRERIESWEEIDGDCGMHPADLRIDPLENQAVLDRLAALGYVAAPSADVDKAIRDTIACNQFNLAQSLADARDFRGAVDVLNRLEASVRESGPTQLLLTSCYLGLEERGLARAAVERLITCAPDEPRLHMMLGALEFADGNADEALRHLDVVAAAEPRLPGLHNKLGEVYLSTKRYDRAVAAFEKALTIDPDSPVAYAGLGRARLESGDPQGALDASLIAAELVHHFPRVHFTIGKALAALGDDAGAVEALELCVKQAPRYADAHAALAEAYRNVGKLDKAMTAELRAKGTLA